MLKIIVTNIEWDAPESANLPDEIIINIGADNEYLLKDIDGDADALCTYLSDSYGYCVYGFNAETREINQKTLTKAQIKQLVDDITAFLDKHHMQDGVCIYFNNKRIISNYDWGEDNQSWVVESNVDPHDYFDYAAYNHILSMSFEGALYDIINFYGGTLDEKFREIFEKYGLYFEQGNAWNLTAYPVDDDMDIEYTIYTKPMPTTHLYYYNKDCYMQDFATIMELWYNLSESKDLGGTCVLGAGFEFEYKEEKYFMHACSPYQGSLSHEAHKDIIAIMLKGIGATNIHYHWGNMD